MYWPLYPAVVEVELKTWTEGVLEGEQDKSSVSLLLRSPSRDNMSHQDTICYTQLFVFTSESRDSKGTRQPERVVSCGTTANGHGWMQTAAGDPWVSQGGSKAQFSATVILLKSSGLLLHK